MKNSLYEEIKLIENAVIENDLVTIQKLLQNNFKLLEQLMFTASEFGRVEIIKTFFIPELIEKKHHTDKELLYISTTIYTNAISYEYNNIIELLDTNSMPYDENHLLMAVGRNNTKFVERVLNNQLIPEEKKEGTLFQCVLSAVYSGHGDMLRFLINNGAMHFYSDEPNQEPDKVMKSAIMNERLDMVKLLVELEYPLEALENKALKFACYENNFPTVQYLIMECKQDINIVVDYFKPLNPVIHNKNVIYQWALKYKNLQDLNQKLNRELDINNSNTKKPKI